MNVHVPVETHLRLLLGDFLASELPKIFNFVWTFDQCSHARWCVRYSTIFIVVFKNDRNWVKKLIFRLIFTPPDFVKWRTLWRYISWISFDGRQFSNKASTVFWKSVKSLSFDSNGTYANFQFLSILGSSLLLENSKYCLKPKFQENLHLRNIK